MSAPSVDDDDDDDALTAIPRGARCRRTRARAVTGGGWADARLIEKCCSRLPLAGSLSGGIVTRTVPFGCPRVETKNV